MERLRQRKRSFWLECSPAWKWERASLVSTSGRGSSPLPTYHLRTGVGRQEGHTQKCRTLGHRGGLRVSPLRAQTRSFFPILMRLPQDWWVLDSHQHLLHQLTRGFHWKLLGWTSSFSSSSVPATPVQQLQSVGEPSFASKTANNLRQGDIGGRTIS